MKNCPSFVLRCGILGHTVDCYRKIKGNDQLRRDDSQRGDKSHAKKLVTADLAVDL